MDRLRAMASFVRIVERGSLTAAAAELGVSLPSMVRTLAALEGSLGVTLLDQREPAELAFHPIPVAVPVPVPRDHPAAGDRVGDRDT